MFKIYHIAVYLLLSMTVTPINFTKVGPDELTLILSNLETRTAAKYRFISSKWNIAYSEITKKEIADLRQTESLLQQLEQQEFDERAIEEIINQIITIRQRNLFKEQYSLNFHPLINKWFYRDEKNTMHKRERLSLELGLDSIESGRLDTLKL